MNVLLTNTVFLRIVAIVLMLVVTARYFLKKGEPTFGKFVVFILGNLASMSILCLACYLEDENNLPYILILFSFLTLADVVLVVRAFTFEARRGRADDTKDKPEK